MTGEGDETMVRKSRLDLVLVDPGGRILRLSVLLALLHLIFPRKAYAYLDPGTTSYILQLVIAALVGVSFAVKLYSLRMKTCVFGLLDFGQQYAFSEPSTTIFSSPLPDPPLNTPMATVHQD